MEPQAEPWVKEAVERSSPGRGEGGLPENPWYRFFLRPLRGSVHFFLVTHGFALTGFTVGYFPAPLPGLTVANEPGQMTPRSDG